MAGVKGVEGGFADAGSDFGEPEMKNFIGHTKATSRDLEEALGDLDCDVRIALLHYSRVYCVGGDDFVCEEI